MITYSGWMSSVDNIITKTTNSLNDQIINKLADIRFTILT